MKLICTFSVFFLSMSIWILLPHHSDILSHFMYFNFLGLFFFSFLVYITSEKQLFPHRHQSIISFLCCALPSPLLFLCSPFCLCSASSLFLSLIPLLLFFFLWCSSWCFLFILPAKLNEVLHWEGACKQQLACLEGYARSGHLHRNPAPPSLCCWLEWFLLFIQGCMHSPFVKSRENEGDT